MLDPYTENRLTEMEVKMAFATDLIDHLNTIVIQQQHQLERLSRELTRIKAQAAAGGPIASGDPAIEVPPHY